MRRVVRTRNDLLTGSTPEGRPAYQVEADAARSRRQQAEYDSLPAPLRRWLSTFRLGLPTGDIMEAIRRCNGDVDKALAMLEELYEEAYPTIVKGTTPQQ